MICVGNSIKKHHLFPDYKKLFKQPPVLVSRDFSIWVSKNHIAGLTRFGIIALKKHIRSAVTRNKAKRVARAVLNQYAWLFTGQDLIVVIKNFTKDANYICKWRKKLIGVCSWVEHFLSKH